MPARRIIERCRTLGALSETEQGLLRTFLSPPMREVHRHLRAWMEAAGMRVWVDAVGNVRGVYPADRDGARRLAIGSHVDTVPDAGMFDGVLGVMLAIELVDSLGGRRMPFEIEVAAFSEEEGVRFGVPYIGSRALVGQIDAALLARIEAAIRAFGLDPAGLPEAQLDNSAFGYVEFHIEQGPVLESLGAPLGVVTSIVGQSRSTATFRGRAGHAGTTPMHLRHDALAGAARWISVVERHARSVPGLVATVGSMQVLRGAGNVIPGEVRLSLDVRHAEDGVRRSSVEKLRHAAERIAGHRGLTLDWQTHLDATATPCDPALMAAMSRAVEAAGFPVHWLTSGAGHDAVVLAARVPVAMLFVRSPGGVSHHPDETVEERDVDAALAAGVLMLSELGRLYA